MHYLSYLFDSEPKRFASLLAGLGPHGVGIIASQPGRRLAEAFEGLCPLGFEGAFLDGDEITGQAPALLNQLEPLARQVGRVDAVRCGWNGLKGYFLAPQALALLIERHVFPGARAIWVGRLRPELAPGLKGISRLDVAAEVPSKGEAFLAALPMKLRGEVAVREEEVRALAARADLVVYAGGGLPSSLLQPYHTVLSLAKLPSDVVRLVDRVIGHEYFWGHRLALVARELLGLALPPEIFYGEI